MTNLIAKASGNFLDDTSWASAEATSLSLTETNNSALTTSPAASPGFTPGAVTVDGIAVKIATKTVSASGTFTLEIAQAGTPVSGAAVTINVADIPTSNTTFANGGWIFLKFASPVTLTAATQYTIRAYTSLNSQVTLYRSSTTSDWTRMLRLVGDVTPAAGDNFYIGAEYTGAGARTNLTITINNTATTDFGSVGISQGGTLTFGTSSATDYYLKMSGNLNIFANGTLNVGTSGTPMPSDSTAVIEFDPASDGQYGMYARSGCILNMYGTSKTVKAMLAADASASATSMTSDVSTSWKSGDSVGVASTTRTPTECEVVTLSGDASGATVPISALSNAHSGTSPYQAELINLTRNIKFRSATSTFGTFLNIQGDAAVHIQYISFRYIGDASTNRGIEVSSNFSATLNIIGCSFRDCEYSALTFGSSTGSINLTNNVFYNIASLATSVNVIFIGNTTGSISVTGNVLMLSNSSSSSGAFRVGGGATIENNCIVGTNNANASGFSLDGNDFYPSVSGNTVHSCLLTNTHAFIMSSGAYGTIDTLKIWRCTGNGIRLNRSELGKVFLTSPFMTGLSDACIEITGDVHLEISDGVFDGESSYSSAAGIEFVIASTRIILKNCSFGEIIGFTTADIKNYITVTSRPQLIAYNCVFGSSTEVTTMALIDYNSYIRLHKKDEADVHINYYKYGTAESDTSVRHTDQGFSWKLTPASASRKLNFPGPTEDDTFKVQVQDSVETVIALYVRKDSSYNGNAPRLIVVGGIVEGVDQEIDSLTVGADTWEELSVSITPTENGVVQFYVDCDGTAGSVYVDDVAVTV